jgi:hypothetical protein
MYASTDSVRTNVSFADAHSIITSATQYADTEAKKVSMPIKLLMKANSCAGNILVSLMRLETETDHEAALDTVICMQKGWKAVHLVPLASTQAAWIFGLIREYLTVHERMTGIRIPDPLLLGGTAPDFTTHLHFDLPVRQ